MTEFLMYLEEVDGERRARLAPEARFATTESGSGLVWVPGESERERFQFGSAVWRNPAETFTAAELLNAAEARGEATRGEPPVPFFEPLETFGYEVIDAD